MKRGGSKGNFIKPLINALESAGFELTRRSTSHFIYAQPGQPHITVPSKLDSHHLAQRIAKIAGVHL